MTSCYLWQRKSNKIIKEVAYPFSVQLFYVLINVHFHINVFFSAWLEGEDDPVIYRVNQRIEDITGLTVDTAELLQVM